MAHEALFREWPRLRGWLTRRRRRPSGAAPTRAGRIGVGRRGSRADRALARHPAPVGPRGGHRPTRRDHPGRAGLPRSRPRIAVEAEEDAVRLRAAATGQAEPSPAVAVGRHGGVSRAGPGGRGDGASSARGSAEDSADEAGSAVAAGAKRLAADALNEDRPGSGAAGRHRGDQARPGAGDVRRPARPCWPVSTTPSRGSAIDGPIPAHVASAPTARTVYLSDNKDSLCAVDTLSADLLWRARSPAGGAQWGTAVADPDGGWVAAPVFSDDGGVAFLDPGTGSVLREVTVATCAGGAGHVPLRGRVAFHLDEDLVVTTESPPSSSTRTGVGRPVVADPVPRPVRARLLRWSRRLPGGVGRLGGDRPPRARRGATGRLGACGGRGANRHLGASDASGVETPELQVRDAAGAGWPRVAFVGSARGALFLDGGRALSAP